MLKVLRVLQVLRGYRESLGLMVLRGLQVLRDHPARRAGLEPKVRPVVTVLRA